MNISCFIAGADPSDLEQTVYELRKEGTVGRICVVSDYDPGIEDIHWIQSASLTNTKTLRKIASHSSGEYTAIYSKSLPLKLGQYGLVRMTRMASDANAGMLYADYYEMKEGNLHAHPTIEYQEGSLRDDFNFGSLVLYKTAALKEATQAMKADYEFAALYDLRLKISQKHRIVRMPEFLYTEVESDVRKTGEKMFD